MRREHFELAGAGCVDWVEERLGRARCHRNVLAMVDAELFPGQPCAALRIIGHRGDGPDIQFGRLQSEGQCEGVVDVIADIGIEDDGNAPLSLTAHCYQE